MFGGRTGTGTHDLSNETWSLWIDRSDKTVLEWRPVPYASGSASVLPRAHHVMVRDEFSDRLLIFGGDVDSTNGDLRAWSEALPTTSELGYQYADSPASEGHTYSYSPSWKQLDGTADKSMTGACAALSDKPITARIPDLYDFSGSSPTCTALTGSPLVQELYPFDFLLPDGTLFTAGPADTSYHLPTLGSPWSKFPTSASATGLWAASAVMYRPGKIMISGSKYATGASGGTSVSNESRWIDLTQSSPTWNATINSMAYPRVNHNLVALPNGKVMAIGGCQLDHDNSHPDLYPEIWDPEAVSGSLHGSWSYVTGSDTLEHMSITRGYHSTALLLPDGRILSSGGNDDNAGGQTKTQIYCPPYLFKSNGDLAARPEITSAPVVMQWGKTYTVCTPSTSGLTRVCLIAPGSPTHGFDQNQRYVPLTFSTATSPTRIFVTMPPDGNTAPPGYYLMFLVGSADGSDVPSIAQWVRVIDSGDADGCDAVAPAVISNFQPDWASSSEVSLVWSAPGDDGSIAGSGPAQEFDLRSSSAPISNSSNWNSATQFSGEPVPGVATTGHDYTASGLAANAWYHFALRAKDDNGNYSALQSGDVKAQTMTCFGCGSMMANPGGGTADVSLSGSGRGSSRGIGAADVSLLNEKRQAAAALATGGTASSLVIETERTITGWSVHARRVSEVIDAEAAMAGAVAVQVRTGDGGWGTQRRFTPGLDSDVIGLCALADGRRMVLPGNFQLEAVGDALPSSAGTAALAAAVRAGNDTLDTEEQVDPSKTALAVGDSMTVSYTTGGAGEADQSWFVMVRRVANPGGAQLSRMGSAVPVPLQFALGQNVPNPFRGSTRIPFALPTTSHVRIEIFDLLGRRVKTLTSGEWAAGYHQVDWDHTTDNGQAVGAGVYLYRLTAGEFRDQKRMVLSGR